MLVVHRGVKLATMESWAMNKIFLGVGRCGGDDPGGFGSVRGDGHIDGITVNDYGRVNPAGPDYAQPGSGPVRRRSRSAR